MHFGPRFDHTCMVVRTNNEKFILSAGGWNNSAMHETEIFSVKNERWMPVKFTSGVTADDPPKNIYANSLLKGLRSSKMASIKNIPLLAGGVECDGYVQFLESNHLISCILMSCRIKIRNFYDSPPPFK